MQISLNLIAIVMIVAELAATVEPTTAITPKGALSKGHIFYQTIFFPLSQSEQRKMQFGGQIRKPTSFSALKICILN